MHRVTGCLDDWAATLADRPTTIHGVETDRVQAIATELRRLGQKSRGGRWAAHRAASAARSVDRDLSRSPHHGQQIAERGSAPYHYL
jgi:hypothetical protein